MDRPLKRRLNSFLFRSYSKSSFSLLIFFVTHSHSISPRESTPPAVLAVLPATLAFAKYPKIDRVTPLARILHLDNRALDLRLSLVHNKPHCPRFRTTLAMTNTRCKRASPCRSNMPQDGGTRTLARSLPREQRRETPKKKDILGRDLIKLAAKWCG